MTKKELGKHYIAMHRKMWTWLAENPEKSKQNWPGWNGYDYGFEPDGYSHCFLCAYTFKFADKDCADCPLSWGITDMCMDTQPEDSYYNLYDNVRLLEQRSMWAKVIANLPEKDEIEVMHE